MKEQKGQKETLDDFEKLIEGIREICRNAEPEITVVNLKRMQEMHRCRALLRKVFEGEKIQETFTPHDGPASAGSIRIRADRLVVRNSKLFHDAVRLASNYEIYPRTDGKIAFSLMFYGLTDNITEG